MTAELLSVLLERSEGWMRLLVFAAAMLWISSLIYNNRGVRTMVRDLSAALRAAGRAFAAALRIPGEKPGGRGVATMNAAIFSALCGLVVVELLVCAGVLLTRNYYGALTLAQFAVGAALMAALTVVARLCRAEAYRALAKH